MVVVMTKNNIPSNIFFVNSRMPSILEKSAIFGLISARANQAADMFAVIEDNALRNALRVLFTNII